MAFCRVLGERLDSINRCQHCGGPLPAGIPEDERFCCEGCRAVSEALVASGLSEFYSIKDRIGNPDIGQRDPGQGGFEYFDHPGFFRDHVDAVGDGCACTRLYLEGVHCAACVWLLERLPQAVPGVHRSVVRFGTGVLDLEFDPKTAQLSHIAETLDRFGYRPHPFVDEHVQAAEKAEERDLLKRLGVAAVSAGNTMLIAVSLYEGLFSGIEPRYRIFFQWISLFLALPAVVYSAQPFYQAALSSFMLRRLHIDVPISIGVVAAFLFSCYATFTAQDHVYFDSVCALIFFLLLGRWVQRRALRRSQREFLQSSLFLPKSALVLREESELVPLSEVVVGDRVRVLVGERVPVDGEILSGVTELDVAVLTGESRPQRAQVGDQVFAGSLNLSGVIEVSALQPGSDSRVQRLLTSLVEAASRRAPIVEVTDRLSGHFVFGVVLLATATFFYWLGEGFHEALNNAVALLVITCPCALALATPVAMSVAVARAAKAGILIKGSDVVERLLRARQVFIDKTGTLTEGDFSVSEIAYGPGEIDREEAWSRLIGLETAVPSHPISRALIGHSNDQLKSGATQYVWEPKYFPGLGVEATDSDGAKWRVGAPRWAIEASTETLSQSASWIEQGYTPIVLTVSGRPVLSVALSDRLRPNAKLLIETLRERADSVRLLSGDDPRVVEYTGTKIGLEPDECIGGVLPEEKARLVSSAGGATLMVGDGVNDASALGAASVGVGLRGDAETALEAADVFIVRGGVDAILELLHGSKRTFSVIKRNLAFSLLYNLVGGGAAVMGLVNPLVAALLMPASSLTVVLHSIWSTTFRSGPQTKQRA